MGTSYDFAPRAPVEDVVVVQMSVCFAEMSFCKKDKCEPWKCEHPKGRRLPHYTTYGGTRYACDPKYKQGPEFMTQFRENFVERAVKQLTKWGCECNKECKCICDVDQYK